MPNHVTTRCTVTGDEASIAAFRQRMFVEHENEHDGKYLCFDFGQIIPMPASVEATDGILGTNDILSILLGAQGSASIWERLGKYHGGEHLGPWKGLSGFSTGEIQERLEKAFPGCIDRARKMALCFGETGYRSWYDWSVAYWGTKWNSYSLEIDDDGRPFKFKFETAWDFPTPVFAALAAAFPTLSFYCVTYDEGSNFAGGGYFNPPNGSPEFSKGPATDELYEAVYLRSRDRDEDDEAEKAV